MNFNLQKTEELYPLLTDWWKGWDWVKVPRDILPEQCLVVSGYKPLCAGFLYITNSQCAWFDYMVSDPTADKHARREALDILIKNAIVMARGLGKNYMFHTTKHEGLIKKFKEMNFAEIATGTTNLMGRLN